MSRELCVGMFQVTFVITVISSRHAVADHVSQVTFVITVISSRHTVADHVRQIH